MGNFINPHMAVQRRHALVDVVGGDLEWLHDLSIAQAASLAPVPGANNAHFPCRWPASVSAGQAGRVMPSSTSLRLTLHSLAPAGFISASFI
jgi:hypothetical protein